MKENHKVVQLCLRSVGYTTITLLQIYCWVRWKKNFKNSWTVEKLQTRTVCLIRPVCLSVVKL